MRRDSGMSLQNLQYDNKAEEQSAATIQDYSAGNLGYGDNKESGRRQSPDCAVTADAESGIGSQIPDIKFSLFGTNMDIDNTTEKDRIRSLKEAVIMAEIISPPVCKRSKRRRLL